MSSETYLTIYRTMWKAGDTLAGVLLDAAADWFHLDAESEEAEAIAAATYLFYRETIGFDEFAEALRARLGCDGLTVLDFKRDVDAYVEDWREPE